MAVKPGALSYKVFLEKHCSALYFMHNYINLRIQSTTRPLRE